DVEQIALGEAAACARTVTGELRCWGRLYDVVYPSGGGTVHFVAPTIPPTARTEVGTATELAMGKDHACIVYETSAVGCMGTNGSLQSLYHVSRYVLEEVTLRPLTESPVGFVRLALGDDHSCGLTTSQTVYCWGATTHGQIMASCV